MFNRKKRIIIGIAAFVMVLAIGFSIASPQPTQAAIDCSTVDRGPKACTGAYWPGDDPTRFNSSTSSAITFLISGCGALNINGDRIPCYHSVNGMIQILFTIVDLILGLVGALALLMFVWGGFQWLMSGGEEERVKGGTSTLRNAIIGLLIVFGAWIGVNFVVTTLAGDDAKGTLFFGTSAANKWYNAKLGALCYRALTSEELACQLAEPYKPVAPVAPSVRSSPTEQVACCYTEKTGTKRATAMDNPACAQEVNDLNAQGRLQTGSAAFLCKYSGPTITAADLCWKMDSSRGGSVPLYCSSRTDISITTTAPATPATADPLGVCCVSRTLDTSPRTHQGEGYYIKKSACQTYLSEWRVNPGTNEPGVFDIKFCPYINDPSLVCQDDNNGWRRIVCPSGLEGFSK
ncbi:hypothetical protein HY622_03755 [Candidatus Uhrbacteria bacterium]|nr:hypothetical protein [Candidatus Uhrbacteria bacterium]